MNKSPRRWGCSFLAFAFISYVVFVFWPQKPESAQEAFQVRTPGGGISGIEIIDYRHDRAKWGQTPWVWRLRHTPAACGQFIANSTLKPANKDTSPVLHFGSVAEERSGNVEHKSGPQAIAEELGSWFGMSGDRFAGWSSFRGDSDYFTVAPDLSESIYEIFP